MRSCISRSAYGLTSMSAIYWPRSPISAAASGASAAWRRVDDGIDIRESTRGVDSEGHADRARVAGCAGRGSCAALRAAAESVLSERSARELWQARAHADARAHEYCGDDTRALAGPLLGREP